jgi:hypothetical protein
MAFTKAGPGRPKGSPNKFTAALKDDILASFEKVGRADYLARMAEKEPSAYMTLLGKVLPMQVTGEGGGPVLIITGVPRDAAD